MIRTSAPFASWILQRQLTEMKEAAVTAMRHVGELADLVRFLPGFFGSITSHVKVEGDTKVKRRLFSWYHPYGGCPTRKTMLERARDDARSDVAYIAQRNSWDSLWLNELPARATPEFQFKESFLVS